MSRPLSGFALRQTKSLGTPGRQNPAECEANLAVNQCCIGEHREVAERVVEVKRSPRSEADVDRIRCGSMTRRFIALATVVLAFAWGPADASA